MCILFLRNSQIEMLALHYRTIRLSFETKTIVNTQVPALQPFIAGFGVSQNDIFYDSAPENGYFFVVNKNIHYENGLI
jgi:hypothetical protein